MLRTYIQVILRRWWLALLPVVIMLGVSLLTYRTPATTYQVTLRFAAGLPPEQTSGVYNYDRQYTWLASEYIANGLSDIARTSLFAENVAKRTRAAGLALSPGQIQGAIASDQIQSIFDIYLTWPDPGQITTIASAITAEFNESAAAYWPQLSATTSAPVRPLDMPVPVPIAPSLRDRFDLPVRVILAVAAGLALALIAHVIDPFIHERRELEHLGFDVVGVIPRQKQ